MKIPRVCETCGIAFLVYKSQGDRKYCNRSCYTMTGTNNPNWKGGKIVVSGYVYCYAPAHPNATKDGYVCEHRLVIEAAIGRLLSGKEVVHHKDENPMNNSIDNLLLYENSGKHTVAHHTRRNKAGKFGESSPLSHPNQKLTPEQNNLAVIRKQSGDTYRAIAEDFGVTISCIAAVIRKHRHITT